MRGVSGVSGAPSLGELPRRGASADLPVADRTEQRDDVLQIAEAGLPREADGEPGEVEAASATPGVLGHGGE